MTNEPTEEQPYLAYIRVPVAGFVDVEVPCDTDDPDVRVDGWNGTHSEMAERAYEIASEAWNGWLDGKRRSPSDTEWECSPLPCISQGNLSLVDATEIELLDVEKVI